ncbi:thermonuclease family protein [Candidatus Pelagibacter bacterium]|nr:thermonuclease family protein [Candidatus Pelagibacter bacterium]
MFLNKIKVFLLISISLIFFFLTYNDVKSEEIKIIEGKAIVVDGDTIKIDSVKIRFSGIDAPESYYKGKEQFCLKVEEKISCGKLSKNFLIKKIGNQKVKCEIEAKTDRYKRKLGECFVNDKSLSRILVKNGYAFDYPRYSKKKYSIEQEYAKKNSLGLWSMKFEFPWNFRKNN